MWDPTTHEVIISRDVIFTEDKLQEMGDDSTMKKDSETIIVQLEKNHEKEDSSEDTP